jgi:ubiquinone biosynthesis protein
VHKISIGKLLKQLFEITSAFKMETQPQLLLLQKTMVTIEGVGLTIYPEVNMWKLAEPWIKEWAKQNFGIHGKMLQLKSNAIEFTEEAINLMKLANKLLSARECGPKKRIVLQSATYRVFLLGCLVGIIAYYYTKMI